MEQSIKILRENEYIKLDTEGSFQIYISKNEDVQLQKKIALKVINQNQGQELTQLINEYNIMKQLNHENVIKVFDIVEDVVLDSDQKLDKTKLTMIKMEQAQQDFFDYSNNKPDFKQFKQLGDLFYQIACGLYYLHQQKIAHNDMKLENILIFNNSIAKIADFGYSRKQDFIYDNYGFYRQQQKIFWQNRILDNTSPEIVQLLQQPEQQIKANDNPEDELKADVFSYGIMLLLSFFRSYPYLTFDLNQPRQSDQVFKYIFKKQYHLFWLYLNNVIQTFHKNNVPEICVNQLKNLIEQCIAFNPSERLCAQQIVDHPFFTESKKL